MVGSTHFNSLGRELRFLIFFFLLRSDLSFQRCCENRSDIAVLWVGFTCVQHEVARRYSLPDCEIDPLLA